MAHSGSPQAPHPEHTLDGAEARSSTPCSHERPLPAETALPPGSVAYLVLQRHAQLGQLSHFELLDVPEHADTATIRRAFQQAVLRYHPDRLRGDHERLRPLAKEIVHRIGIAYRVLEDDASRAQYRRSLEQHLPPPVRSSLPSPRLSLPSPAFSAPPTLRPESLVIRSSTVPAPSSRATTLPPDGRSMPLRAGSDELEPADDSSAEQAFAAAKVQLAEGLLEEALELIEEACRTEPGRPRYHALHAWVRAQRVELAPGPFADEILMTLTWALRERRTDVDIRLYRARVLQRLGRHDEALHDFSIVASMDPDHQEALREVRLYRSRREREAAR